MPERMDPVRLQDGTLVRHKVTGYEGRIDGTTEIRTCFTAGGKSLEKANSKQIFQYRVVVKGQPMRQIAPAEDLEILDGVVGVTCPRCHSFFHSRPGVAGKPAGRCQCGGWICPSCLTCQRADDQATTSGQVTCREERKRVARKLSAEKNR